MFASIVNIMSSLKGICFHNVMSKEFSKGCFFPFEPTLLCFYSRRLFTIQMDNIRRKG